MLKHIARKVTFGVALAALVTPIAFASPIGTDPEPRVTQPIPAVLGLA
jgi:hypothetical protein